MHVLCVCNKTNTVSVRDFPMCVSVLFSGCGYLRAPCHTHAHTHTHIHAHPTHTAAGAGQGRPQGRFAHGGSALPDGKRPHSGRLQAGKGTRLGLGFRVQWVWVCSDSEASESLSYSGGFCCSVPFPILLQKLKRIIAPCSLRIFLICVRRY